MKSVFLKILMLSLLISIIGILSIYSGTYQKDIADWQVVSKRQVIWLGICLIFFLAFSSLNYRRLWDWTYFLYAAIILLLMSVFILGVIRQGAQRWLKLFWFNFQPSEFAKLVSVIFLARYYSRKSINDISLLSAKFGLLRGVILPFIYIGLPVFLIIEQPDLGTGVLILILFLVMLLITGVRFRYLLLTVSCVLFSLPVFWGILRDYQKERLLVFLNPNADPLGAGYTVIQSKIAIGSGGFWGKGWLSGTQSQLHFLPESHTDFIFATFAEQWGFIGSLLLLLLYFLLIREGILIGVRSRDDFGKLLAFGIISILAVQIFVNIAMNLGLAPVVGIPLPLMSYGGSSMLVTFIALGILVSINRRRTVF